MPKEVRKNAGHAVKLSIRVSGYPDPEVLWLKDNVPVKNTSKTKITSYSGIHALVIPKVLPEDCGLYQVVIKNSSGMIQSACMLVVEGKIDLVQFLCFAHS